MIKSGSTERHPLLSILLLVALMIAGAIVFSIIAFVAGAVMYGPENLLSLANPDTAPLGMLRLLQILSSFGMFVVPAIAFARIQTPDWLSYLRLNSFHTILTVICLLIMFASAPVLELSSQWNKAMKLPEYLRGLEEWMKLKEYQMGALTKQLLVMDSWQILAVNVLMFAVIPALGEEFIFRGCIQRLLGVWFKNKHVAIWTTAIIFSAIHFQFYGFLPRMLLGAMFGYLLLWSGTIWIPVAAHFINNGVAVLTAYVYQQKGIPLEKLEEGNDFSVLMIVFSFLACLALLWLFRNLSLKYGAREGSDGTGLG